MVLQSEWLHEVLLGVVRSVEPTSAQKEGASRSQTAIREALDSGNIGRRILGEFLIGSYARHTAIAPLDDVDIVFLIDPHEWPIGMFETLPSPEKVLNTFESAIRLRYPNSQVVKQRRSIGLHMNHLAIDAVPAITTEREFYLKIPDRDEGEWILTAPQLHSHLATDVNKLRGGWFKPLVKILKNWNASLPDGSRLKSFTIETMALRIFKETAFVDLFDGALKFFDFLSDAFSEKAEFVWEDDFGVELAWHQSYSVLDAVGLDTNLVAGLNESRRTGFLEAAHRSRNGLLKASRARSLQTAREHLFRALRSED